MNTTCFLTYEEMAGIESNVEAVIVTYIVEDEETTETADREVQQAGRGFNPEAQCFMPIDSLSSSLSNLSLSPGGLSPSSPTSSAGWPSSASTSPSMSLFSSTYQKPAAPFVPKEPNKTQMTAAMFAQTKFGSTKLKTNAKRPTRLSPTEFGNYFRQRSAVLHPGNGYCSPQRPRSLSPRDPRLEFLIDQQNRLLMTQQQQIHQQHMQQLHQQQLLHSPQHTATPSPVSDGYMRPNAGNPLPGPSFGNLSDLLPGHSPLQSPGSSSATSPDNHKSFVEGLNLNNNVSYPSQYSHLLLAN
ncbi:hypothetical protein FSP39_000601 [Pinctada imbricata]|uniref:Uncharacterized protein n=1 Tax=Pinctada imbricata TaxID=66713 RepID=A0AA89BPE1_PINIB|nr:hypothetical protein FSP39_000601 [Pinctada imbricata]